MEEGGERVVFGLRDVAFAGVGGPSLEELLHIHDVSPAPSRTAPQQLPRPSSEPRTPELGDV